MYHELQTPNAGKSWRRLFDKAPVVTSLMKSLGQSVTAHTALRTATDTLASPAATESKATEYAKYLHKESLSPGAVAGITASCMLVFSIVSGLL